MLPIKSSHSHCKVARKFAGQSVQCRKMSNKTKRFEGVKRKGSTDIVRYVIGKLQATSLWMSRVREGHFVVIATQGWQPKRFAVELSCLDNPEFLKLLKQAEEEFGFCQDGALAIPCGPDELRNILGIRRL